VQSTRQKVDLDRVLTGKAPLLTGGTQSRRRYAEPAADAPRALLVDDDPLVRRIHTSRLLMDGWRVDAASNGAEALTLADQVVPTAILLDLGLPDTDGLALLSLLRAKPGFAEVPILVFTNALRQDQLDQATFLGYILDLHLQSRNKGYFLWFHNGNEHPFQDLSDFHDKSHLKQLLLRL
jgi:CheY-like chemotaxis protein